MSQSHFGQINDLDNRWLNYSLRDFFLLSLQSDSEPDESIVFMDPFLLSFNRRLSHQYVCVSSCSQLDSTELTVSFMVHVKHP